MNAASPTFFPEDDCQAHLTLRGEPVFPDQIAERLGRVVRPVKRGPKPGLEGKQVWCLLRSAFFLLRRPETAIMGRHRRVPITTP